MLVRSPSCDATPCLGPGSRRAPGAWPRAWGRAVWATALAVVFWLWAASASAQATGQLEVQAGRDLTAFEQRAITEVEVRLAGRLWKEQVELQSVRPGDLVSGELGRRALRELDRTGRYADVKAYVEPHGERLVFVVEASPRRIVHQVHFQGGVLPVAEAERALGFGADDAVTEAGLEEGRVRLLAFYDKSGYPQAKIDLKPEAVDDPRRTLLRIDIVPGAVQRITNLQFLVAPSPHHPLLGHAIERYKLDRGDPLDQAAVLTADEDLLARLVADAFYEAKVSSEIKKGGVLLVKVQSGPHFRVRVEGNEVFSAAELIEQLKLQENKEPSEDMLAEQLRMFLEKQGYLDAYVRVERLRDQKGLETELYVWVRTGQRFEITRRVFPCLSDERQKGVVNDEIDGVLAEQFPPVALLGPAPSAITDRATGSPHLDQAPPPYVARPWRNFSPESYDRVLEHVQDYYRAEGYVDARVGPATLVRRRCAPESPPGKCITRGPAPLPQVSCDLDAQVPEGEKVVHTCVPDPRAGIRCEAEATLVLPVIRGRQAILYDVTLEGNEYFSETEILKWAALPLGKALKREVLDAALRRIVEHYEEEAFAFAQVDSEIELSSDHSRARLVISIVERKQVTVERIEVSGATETSETLIRSRLALKAGKLYRRSRVLRSQEQVQSLGVFTSVTVGMADPGVPAKQKVVLVQVTERMPQYLDTKAGFASADGFRISFEYGHRNLGGNAVHLILRSQLALRPLFLITEEDVREKYQELSALELLERRNTITLAFPDIGLGPLFGFEAELLDLRSNERDYSHARDAAVLRLLFIPRRQYQVNLGGTVELNDAQILGGDSLLEYVKDNPGVNIRYPEGRSIAYTQNLGASWDLRDQPLAATEGTFIGATMEHVTAVPLGENEGKCNEDSTEVFDPVCSELLRYSGKISGYIPLNKKGLSFAVSFRAGYIQHLTDLSRTYPDRLFFMGGVDSIRGYTQYSLVPQDLAELVLEGDEFTIDEIVLRGGDVFINPRMELRVPITASVATAFFVDSGNLWADSSNFNPLVLRYTTGTGLRIKTPVGPLVFDYGFNIDRVLDKIDPSRKSQRTWEDIGAFHFSIGLF